MCESKITLEYQVTPCLLSSAYTWKGTMYDTMRENLRLCCQNAEHDSREKHIKECIQAQLICRDSHPLACRLFGQAEMEQNLSQWCCTSRAGHCAVSP